MATAIMAFTATARALTCLACGHRVYLSIEGLLSGTSRALDRCLSCIAGPEAARLEMHTPDCRECAAQMRDESGACNRLDRRPLGVSVPIGAPAVDTDADADPFGISYSEAFLEEIILDALDDDTRILTMERYVTALPFDDDAGLVVTFRNGRVFNVTIAEQRP